MRIIQLSGKKGSGKSTIQELIASKAFRNLNMRVAKINYADELYTLHNYALNRLRGFGMDIPEGHIDRTLLQYLGTEWGRGNYGQNIWVDVVKNKVGKEVILHTDLVVIADCRFENEFDAFPTSFKVRLLCPEEIRKERCKKWGNSEHPSETGLDKYESEQKFDMYIHTDNTPPDLCADLILNRVLYPEERV